jgi:hypothetical protein
MLQAGYFIVTAAHKKHGSLLYVTSGSKPTCYRLVTLSLPPRISGKAHSCMQQVEVYQHVTSWLFYRYRRAEVEGSILVSIKWVF